MSLKFDQFYYPLIKVESGYANVKGDDGRETYKGVTRRFWGHLPMWEIIDSYKKNYPGGVIPRGTIFQNATLDAQIKAFYKAEFWDKYHFEDIYNQSIARLLADWSVNGWNENRVADLQRFVGAVGDGDWGEDSTTSLNKFAKSAANQQAVFYKIKDLRAQQYKADDDWERFKDGWTERLNDFSFSFLKAL